MSKRLKLRTRAGALRPGIEDGYDDLGEWVADKIPLPPPEGTLCEREHSDWPSPPLATTYLWRIKDGHVCYSYVCEDCGWDVADGEGPDPEDYPTTKDGYAVVPRHCA